MGESTKVALVHPHGNPHNFASISTATNHVATEQHPNGYNNYSSVKSILFA